MIGRDDELVPPDPAAASLQDLAMNLPHRYLETEHSACSGNPERDHQPWVHSDDLLVEPRGACSHLFFTWGSIRRWMPVLDPLLGGIARRW